jgi:hypothetical protein
MPNRLINSHSPYLLQHAHNPVDWYPWGEDALSKAVEENKIIILSVGYSACHWCHVMEKNCFENEAIASVMNAHFVNIKVDREERPDLDQIYMESLHLMGQRGGWPMNVFLTPDQLPFYGGTYFPPDQWLQILNEISVAQQKRPEELQKVGIELQEGLYVSELKRMSNRFSTNVKNQNTLQVLEGIFEKFKYEFDTEWGGFGSAPKFPMPCVYDFLLFYHHLTENKDALKMVTTTLEKMAYGGIKDQLGGGFARYSVDGEWKVPHFEKMLYDNAQLLSLYSHAYGATLDILNRDVCFGIVNFLKQELTSDEGGFYSALDADSEGVEGKYYAWTKSEILEILGPGGEEFCSFYQVTEEGNFEHGINVLWRTVSEEDFTMLYSNRSHSDMHKYIVESKRKLLEARDQRVKPSLDNKILASWNALMTKGLIDAYRTFDQPEMLKLAYDNATFISEKMLESDGKLWHVYTEGKVSIDGFLDDYAFTIEALVALYEATFHENWLNTAKKLADYSITHFYDSEEGLFHFTSNVSEKLIARKKEIMDNVIPSSNAAMAMALKRLAALFGDEKYDNIVKRMLQETEPLILAEGRYMSHWLQVWLMDKFPLVEIAFVGRNAMKYKKEIDKIFFPNKVICGTVGESKLPLLENRKGEEGQTQIYVCQDNICRLPSDDVSSAFRQLRILREEMVKTINSTPISNN